MAHTGSSKTIYGKDLFINSAGKLNRSMGIVKSGTGVHKNKKAYDRKNKHKKYYDLAWQLVEIVV